MDAGGPQVRVVCVTTGAGDGDDDVANHWNARGTQAAFRKAGTALAAAGARSARRRASCFARAATRILTGTARIPASILESAWDGTQKSLRDCQKGHGFGSGSGRRGAKASAGNKDVQALQKTLREKILEGVGHDTTAARDLLRELTKYGDRPGFDSVDRITSPRVLEIALDKLKQHPTFGENK